MSGLPVFTATMEYPQTEEPRYSVPDYTNTANGGTVSFVKINLNGLAVDYINSASQLNARKIDGGFKYEGKISLGDFVLIQNEDNSFDSLTVKSADYKIQFIN